MAEYLGGGLPSTSPAHIVEDPAPAKITEPPKSNSGFDDPKGGISEGSGGVSSTADIGSPVKSEPESKTVVGSVLESVFGKKERTAEEADAEHSATIAATGQTSTTTTAPSETTHTGQENSGTYIGAITGAAAAGTAAVASVIPGMGGTQETSKDATATGTQSTGPAITSSNTAPSTALDDSTIKPSAAAHTSTNVPSTTTREATLGEKAQEVGAGAKDTIWQAAQSTSETAGQAAESVSETTSKAAESASETAAQATQSVKETADQAAVATKETADQAAESTKETATKASETVEEGTTADDGKEKKGEVSEEKKKVSEHAAAVRENKDAIPTAGGEKVGEAHQGESKIIPADPGPQPEDEVPGRDSTTQANTAQNTGEPVEGKKSRLSMLGGHKKDEAGTDKDKPKFMDKLKSKFSKDKS